jgi:hypothetical protein
MTSFIDRKYAHMEEVFAPKGKGKPTLPFSEFITDHGTHPIVYTAIPGKHSSEHHYRARYSIPLRGEIVRVSVVSGALFHCAPDAPYEVRINGAEPYGCMTDEELMLLLAKIVTGNWHQDDEDKGKHYGL